MQRTEWDQIKDPHVAVGGGARGDCTVICLVANYPRSSWLWVSELPSFLSGLTRSLSHVNHWGELTHNHEPWNEPPSTNPFFGGSEDLGEHSPI